MIKRTYHRSLAVLALAAAVAVAAVDYTARAFRSASDHIAFAFDWAVAKAVGAMPANAEPVKAASLVGFVVHRAHVLRQVKRERPVVTSRWRSCPSV